MQPQLHVFGSGHYGTFLAQTLENVTHPVMYITEESGNYNWEASDATHIIIATPNFSHFELVARALKAGKHVLCEKPLALTADEVKKLYHLAHAYKRYLGVGFVLMNHPFYSFIKAGQQQYGPIRSMRVFNHATEHLLQPEWYWNREQSGGWFLVSEIHWYHLFAWLTGAKDFKVVQAYEEKKDNKTVATWSHIKTPAKQELLIDHRLDMSYGSAWTKVEVVFDKVTIVVNDWVPRSAVFPSDETQLMLSSHFVHNGTVLWDKRDRGEIYRDLVRENIIQLLNEHPTDRSAEIILAHKTALEAQKLSDKTKTFIH